jgi:hypothetical protein
LPVSKGSADSRYGLQRFKRYNVSGWGFVWQKYQFHHIT